MLDGDAHLSVVDALTQAQVIAKKFGWTIRLVDAAPELLELLDLVGLELSVEVRG